MGVCGRSDVTDMAILARTCPDTSMPKRLALRTKQTYIFQRWTQGVYPRHAMSVVLDTLKTCAFMPDTAGHGSDKHVQHTCYICAPDMQALQTPAVGRQPQDALLQLEAFC